MGRVVALAVAVVALAAPALASGAPTHQKPLPAATLQPPEPRLTKAEVTRIFLTYRKVASWLDRYPEKGRTSDATYAKGSWKVNVWWGAAGEIATGRVDDTTGAVTEAWTGPQVAWKMARGYSGAFGGREINSAGIWLAFCAVFLVGLADLRRPLSIRNLDLLVLLSFSVSLLYFNRGDVFMSVPLAYPPLVYLLVRMVWSAWRGRLATASAPVWPVWMLLAATIFLAGFRVGLNVERSNVIDVGYSGVIGAERIVNGQAPWGNFPVEHTKKACGPADASGEIRNWIQTNGRCESANPQGDTYGPTAYESYIPGYLVLGWTGKWDDLPAAHFTSIAFDLLTLLGLWLVGLRFGGPRLAAVLAFAWAAYPFTQYVSNSNTNDALMPCFLVWGFWFASAPVARGVLAAFSGWTKFASLIVAPLWLTYPGRRPSRRFALGFAGATLAVFSILLFASDPLHEAHVFWTRTIGWQIGREAPWSLWDWRQYHARGLPDLHLVQRVLEAALVLVAIAAAFWPRRKSPLQLAALTGALLAGFELVQTYWLYTYIPWFYPFAAVALLAPALPLRRLVTVSGRDSDELDSFGAPRVGARDEDALQPHVAFGRLEPDG
jgi:hypothetical protein